MALISPPKPPNGLYDLLPSDSSIRLLKFNHETNGDLHFNLRTAELTEPLYYLAVSYVWGSPYLNVDDAGYDARLVFDRNIYCNTFPIAVTRNAFSLLEQISRLLPDRQVWMDSVRTPIPTYERSKQVLLMKDIYSTAAGVIAWLGHEHQLLGDLVWASTVFKDAVEAKFGLFGGENSTRPRSEPGVLYDPRFWQAISLPPSPSRLEQATKFTAICQWFNRSWIVQEVCLAKDISVLCGSTWIPWGGLFWLGAMFSTPWGQISQSQNMPLWLRQAPSLGYRVWEYQFVRARLASPDVIEATTIPTTSRISQFLTHLLGHIRMFRETQCSDGRDKVYSLLGLVKLQCDKENQIPDDLIPVDYGKYTTEDVYRCLACLSLQHLDNLHLLSSVEDRGVGTTAHLPSWVPDFTQPFGRYPLANGHQKPFRVWNQRKIPIQKPEIRGNELKLWGVQVDSVDSDARPMGGSPEHNGGLASLAKLQMCLPDIQREFSDSRIATLMWTSMMRDPNQACETFPSYDEAKAAYCTFLLTEIANELYQSALQNPEIEEANTQNVKRFLQQFQPEVDAGELPTLESVLEVAAWASAANAAAAPLEARGPARQKLLNLFSKTMRYIHFADRPSKGRRLFRTVSGHLGLGPPSMTEGDEIWILHRGDVPVVLRPHDEGNESIMVQYSPSISEDDESTDKQPAQGQRSPSIPRESGIEADGNEDDGTFLGREDPIVVKNDKRKDGTSDDGSDIGRYYLIGECYLHRYMYGKMQEDDEKLEEKLVPLILI